MTLHRMIREARQARGLTLQQTGDRAEMSPSFLSQVETGRVGSPSWDRLERLSRVLGTDPLKTALLAAAEIYPPIRGLVDER